MPSNKSGKKSGQNAKKMSKQQKQAASRRYHKNKSLKPLPILSPASSTNYQIYSDTRTTGADSVALSAVHWVCNSFVDLSFESATQVASLSLDLSTVARMVDPTSSRDIKASRPTRITAWVLPSALVNTVGSTKIVAANESFGALASVPMYRTPALSTDSETGTTTVTGVEVSQMGSTSTRIQVKTSPEWIKVFDYSFSKAYGEGFAVISPRDDFPDLTVVLNIQFVSLVDGSAITDDTYRVQLRVEGDTQIPQQGAVTADTTYLDSWADSPVITNEPVSKFAVIDYKHLTTL